MVVQEVEFIWKGPGSKVALSGEFVNWESQVPLEKTGSDGWFVVKQVCFAYTLSVLNLSCKFLI